MNFLFKIISWFEKHSKISWIITLIIASIIFYLSSLTFEGINTGYSINSYIYHFSIFFLLNFFLLVSLVQGKKIQFLILGIILAIFYGISDEIHQLFTPGRYCSLTDVLTDSIGILSSGILYLNKLKNY